MCARIGRAAAASAAGAAASACGRSDMGATLSRRRRSCKSALAAGLAAMQRDGAFYPASSPAKTLPDAEYCLDPRQNLIDDVLRRLAMKGGVARDPIHALQAIDPNARCRPRRFKP